MHLLGGDVLSGPQILSIFLLSCQVLVSAQTSADCTQRDVIVNVRDGHGNFIEGLPHSAFQAVFRDGIPRVQSAEIKNEPGRIIVLLDASGSIADSQRAWHTARLIAGDLMAHSRQDSGIALVVFAEKVERTIDFSSRPEDILAWLHDVQDGKHLVPKHEKGTALLDTIMYAIRLFGQTSPGDAIYAITDGNDNRSKSSEDEVENALLNANIRFFAFYATDDLPIPSVERALDLRFLRNLFINTGGAGLAAGGRSTSIDGLSASAKEQLSAQLQYVYDLMSRYYALRIELPVKLRKKRSWELRVVDADGRPRKDLYLSYPRAFPPCASTVGTYQ